MVLGRGTIVITGGAGFIGSHLVDRLLDDGCEKLIVLDNLYRGRLDNLRHHVNDPRLEVIDGDIRDAQAMTSALRGATTVYHLAAQSTVIGAVRDAEYSIQTNVMGTFNVLRAAAEAGIETLVFTSSREVYGDPIDLPVAEDQPLMAVNAYAASKVAGEAYCRAFRRASGLRCVVLRLANVYGPRDVGRVIPVWIERAKLGMDLDVYGGKQVIDFVWIEQVVEALVRVASIPGPVPTLNIGSGTGTRIIDLARRIIRLFGSRSRVTIQQARPVDVTRFVADVARMRQTLGLEPPHDPLFELERIEGWSLRKCRRSVTHGRVGQQAV